MNEMVAWRTWPVIQDQPLLHLESWWIQPPVSKLAAWHEKKKKEEKQASHHSCGSGGRHLFYSSILHEELNVMNCGFSLPRSFSVRNATAAEQLRLQRSSPGFSLTVTQDGPQFKTQRLGQTSRRYSLSLRMIYSFSIHCDHALASPLAIFVFPLCFTLICLHPPSLSSPFILHHFHNDH